MNLQERQQLARFLQQLTQAQAEGKDAEAESLIRAACSRQPDAAYLLVQRAMLLDQAWQNAQAQISRLQAELEQIRSRVPPDSSSFLDPNAWGNAAASRPTPPPAAAPGAAPAVGAWGSGMLGNIATTAAGVVAGGFLFQGIEHMLGSHHSSSGLIDAQSAQLPAEHHQAATINAPLDDSESSSGLFDTSAVDRFTTDDTDSST